MKTRIAEYVRTEEGLAPTSLYKEIARQYFHNLIASFKNLPDAIKEQSPRQPLVQLDDAARATGIDKTTLLDIAIQFFIDNAAIEKTGDNTWEFSVAPSSED